jgi:uncharacterized membrane protein YkoI
MKFTYRRRIDILIALAVAGMLAMPVLLAGRPDDDDDDEKDDQEEQEESITLAQAPAPVKASLQKYFAGKLPADLELERAVENGAVLYEAEWEVNGLESGLEISEGGDILQFENEVRVEDLPGAVTESLMAQFPGGRILEAEKIQRPGADPAAYYEVEVELSGGGKRQELLIAPDGRLL